jgi:hypothetical protein
MNERKITILGEEIAIKFNMAVQLAYEKITKSPFDVQKLNSQESSVALYIACITVCNPDTNITFERLINEASGPEILLLNKTIISAMTEWLDIPFVEPVDKTEEKEGDQPKN